MQLQLPFFPSDTKLINSSLGFRQQDDTVFYLHNGNPIYCHAKNDRQGYKFVLANIVSNKLCSISELSEALGEGRKNIERYAKAFKEHGSGYFFRRKETRGQCYKMTADLLVSIQSELDAGLSIYSIAKQYSISESAISYHIQKGNLKKNSHQI
jgi:biotin operon repressor